MRHDRTTEDEGFTLVLVICFMLVMTILAAATFAVVSGSLTSSQSHQNYDNALNVAEAGIDQTLGRLNQDQTYAYGPTAPASFADADAERDWAKTELLSLASSMVSAGTSLPSVDDGEYVAMRPSGRNTVYAMSFVPSYASAKKTRLLKAEYIFSPYKPGNALLTQGSLCFSGSVVVNALDGTTPAPVHTNADLSGSCSNNSSGGGSGSLTVTGDVTASGTYSVGSNATVGSGSKGGTDTQTIPSLDPRTFYTTYESAHPYTSTSPYDGDWYDLCPNGDVKPPSSTPCSNATVLASKSYRGWTWSAGSGSNPPQWSMTDPGYGGMYYVYQADAYLNTSSNAPYWNGTVVAEAANSDSCSQKSGGNISFKTVNIKAYIAGVVMIAGADLGRLSGSSNGKISNSDVGDGLLGAVDQVYLDTSSTTITGSIIASDECAAGSLGQSAVQGVTLKYDQTTEIPVTDIVRTTEWLEYTG